MIKTKTLTFHSAVNYGAVLQTIALQNVLINNKIDNKIIDYTDDCMKDYNPNDFTNLNFKKKIKKIIKNIFFYKKVNKKYILFNKFIHKNLSLTEKVNNKQQINNVIEDDDILITGSDQVWDVQADGKLSDIYTLNIGKKTNYRISYAASIGSSKINDDNKNIYKEKLQNIDKISVREKTAKIQLDKIIPNKEINITIDPTMLLSSKEWDSLIIPSVNEEKRKYILAYTMDSNKEYIKIANYLSKMTNLPIIYFDLRNKGFKNIYKNAYLSDPFDFVNLIKNAEYVITNSFHGTAFSIIYNKKVWVIPHRTKGSRMLDLLDSLNLNKRIVYSLNDFIENKYNEEIDYSMVNKKINELKKESKEWLFDSIKKR